MLYNTWVCEMMYGMLADGSRTTTNGSHRGGDCSLKWRPRFHSTTTNNKRLLNNDNST